MRSLRVWSWQLLGVALLINAAPASRGDEKPAAPAGEVMERTPVELGIYKSLRDVINKGADLYNKDVDYAGCWRLYEGALIGIKPLLSTKPALQEIIDTGLASAARTPAVDRRAFILREVIDKVRAELNPKGPAVAGKAPNLPPPSDKTLWDRLGGEPNVTKVVDDFVALAATDRKVNFTRGGAYKLDDTAVAQLKKLLIEFVSQATGGPLKYTGRSMKDSHKGMGITDDEFNALAADLKTALEKNGAKPDDVKTVLEVVGTTRKDIVEAAKPEPPKPATPEAKLWDRLGGEANVAKVVDELFATAGPDPKVNFFRGLKPAPEDIAALKLKVIQQVSSLTGGPYEYKGKDMKTAHKGLAITDGEFDAFAGHLKNALEKNGAKPADVAIVMKVFGDMKKDVVEKK